MQYGLKRSWSVNITCFTVLEMKNEDLNLQVNWNNYPFQFPLALLKVCYDIMNEVNVAVTSKELGASIGF